MAEDRALAAGEPRPTPARSGRAWFYAAGLLGLVLAIVSIADMFSPRPNDGIVPMPYSRGGIEVRAVNPAGPAQGAGIQAGRERALYGAGELAANDP